MKLSNQVIASSVLSTIFVAPLAGGDPSRHDTVFDESVAQSEAHQDRALGAADLCGRDAVGLPLASIRLRFAEELLDLLLAQVAPAADRKLAE